MHFEGTSGDMWRRIGCEQLWIPLDRCPEIMSGWFMWALRDAVAVAGHVDTASNARAFYRRLADEIGWACDHGSLACTLPHRATLAPPFHWEYLQETLQSAKLLSKIVLTLGGGNTETLPSEGTPAQLSAFTDLIGSVAPLAGALDPIGSPVTTLRQSLEHQAAHVIYLIYGHGTPVLFVLGIVRYMPWPDEAAAIACLPPGPDGGKCCCNREPHRVARLPRCNVHPIGKHFVFVSSVSVCDNCGHRRILRFCSCMWPLTPWLSDFGEWPAQHVNRHQSGAGAQTKLADLAGEHLEVRGGLTLLTSISAGAEFELIRCL